MKRISFAVLALLMTAHTFAGGVALSTTRVIYDGGKKEASRPLKTIIKMKSF